MAGRGYIFFAKIKDERSITYHATDALLEPSDEEVLGYSSESEDDDEEIEEDAPARPAEMDSEVEQEEEEEGGWGTSKKDYYNNDTIETEMDAQEEEEEAKRLQQKKLQKMSEADFGFDENEWLDTGDNDDEDGDVVTEVLKDVEITPDMSSEERLRILQTRYPEFEFLANEFLQLQPVLQDLQHQAEAEAEAGQISTTIVKCRALAAYVSSLTMYFALLASPARSSDISRTLDPAELRDHPVMDSLLQCRELWAKVKGLKVSTPEPIEVSSEDEFIEQDAVQPNGLTPTEDSRTSQAKKKSKKSLALETAAASAASLRASRLQAAEADLASLSSLLPKRQPRNTSSKKPLPKPAVAHEDSDDSDFGEAETLDAKAAAAKAEKKKSLRFYTSQITQKSNRRAGAGRDAGGDEDLPYRERFRDRQMRLNAEAEKRGKALDSYGRGGGVALGDDGEDDEGQTKVAEEVRGEEDEYYDMVAQYV